MNEFILALLRCKKIGNSKVYNFIQKNRFNINNMRENLKNFIGDEYEMFDTYLKESKNEIEKNKQFGINIITILDDCFPTKLFIKSDPVLYLYYKGNIDLINSKSIAVIGTRHPSAESIKYTKELAKLISENNYTIIGGLALGIDSIAHENANGKTIAVLPSGLDNIQPSSNKKLANEILEHNGCLVSEYSVGSTLNTFNYAKRDRIQSALSNAILVVEATEKSGTMIAVNKALKDGIDVFQMETNNNRVINKTINEQYDNIDKLFLSAEKNYNKQIKREEIINSKNDEQLSLF